MKLSAPGGRYYFNASPGQLEIRNVSLKILILMAYRVSDYSFSGPDWLGSVMLDLVAKSRPVAGQSPQAYQMLMLQGLLAERFKLEIHREVKDMPGYALVIAPGGAKIRRVEADHSQGRIGRGSFTGSSEPLTQLVEILRGTLRRPVQDMTGLSGYYEMNLTWTPDEPVPASAESTATAPDDRGPSIFTALQEQLGLKLESRKVPTTMVFVDHVERVPIDN